MKFPRALEATRAAIAQKLYEREHLEADIYYRRATYLSSALVLLTNEIQDLRRSLVEFEDDNCNGV